MLSSWRGRSLRAAPQGQGTSIAPEVRLYARLGISTTCYFAFCLIAGVLTGAQALLPFLTASCEGPLLEAAVDTICKLSSEVDARPLLLEQVCLAQDLCRLPPIAAADLPEG